ncbi:MAG: hypothetical protein JGK17_23975 [Microcoleus sp. PH2017_10_PVI_O_A]|uniref:hypothetical protein n=1 Tax=unclassified Microcoleus TaxID=2642155 RepID=UPI001D6A26D2|nr:MULTISPECIES: hypothetical protein [unclassified Microcoleus]TAE78965.1 MAG: hypothetical protein EAZ83_23115 [Oscillatoriales cyanobacterium]MCC3408586.1 hypothetical protein [Microcoleus sp. PH2017_10_PVI_O_A]MCC3462676.1 hypothetical protein [Microcoleus sp. PH2017_11_PCY_U_A]MCC3481100.1 hypothetical protein [Microcoleus sp. PH2017_12_PCY_D_A]MCC3527498.1 hypothetical protein [Microcoleus sp. PH2017_21_RUC_O_A]
MSKDPFEVQVQHFAALKFKYQATKYEDSSPSSLLYLILRKADLEFEITKFEWNWLQEHELLETRKAIEQEPQRKKEEPKKLDAKFSQLKSKFKVTRGVPMSSALYPILWKLESENQLTNLEVKYLQQVHGLTETVAIVEDMARFAALKAKYQATEYPNCSLDSPLYQILKQLDARQILSDVEANWLFNNQLVDTLEIFWQQKAVREAEFAQLKDKYKASEYPETSVSNPLYQILKKLKWDLQLSESELNWLEEHQLSETLSIVLEIEQTRHFAELKVKYKANQSEDVSRSSHLYKVLKKIDADNHLGEQDINFLKKRKLTETITLALDKFAATLKSKIQSGEPLSEADIDWLQKNGREDVITFAEKTRFAALKSKYEVSDYKDKTPSSRLYAILQKLDKGERLEPTDVGWLEENKIEASQPSYSYYGWQEERRYQGQRLFSGKIFTAYHKIEALFYEQEYKNTGNKWNLPNASSHWRKADEPKSALKVTENLDFDKIKENKLKSALLTTRGGAFRDIHKLDDAEKCALKAIEYQPQSHHPYTLMGAICFERGEFLEGERWFNEAIKRGASPRDQDAEMKRVVKNAKDEKRREVVEYLLKKDPQRYAWAKAYRKRQGGEDAQRKNS